MTYLTFILVVVASVIRYPTPIGLTVCAAGEYPAAVEAQGLNVTFIRMGAMLVGSGLMARRIAFRSF